MRVLFASSEAYPLAKTGGLADVSAALPQALAELGVDVQVILPGYPCALEAAANKIVEAELPGAPGAEEPTRLRRACMPDSGLPVWLVDCPALFNRRGRLYQDGGTAEAPIGPTMRNGLHISAPRQRSWRRVSWCPIGKPT